MPIINAFLSTARKAALCQDNTLHCDDAEANFTSFDFKEIHIDIEVPLLKHSLREW